MNPKYTYKKSDGEDVWTVGYEKDGKWIPESDWESEYYARRRAEFLRYQPQHFSDAKLATNLRKRIEEMHEGYRIEGELSVNNFNYRRGAADACGLILDLPELRLFLPAKEKK